MIGDTELDYLLAQAGLSLTQEQKTDLASIHDALNAMKARVRQSGIGKPRGHMAEPALTYGFSAEDLA
jgi:hypothetical protein